MKHLLFILVSGWLAVAAFGCGAASLSPRSDDKTSFRHVSQEEARKIMQSETGYIILDVRTREEYDEGHIPGAICIPNEAIQKTPLSSSPTGHSGFSCTAEVGGEAKRRHKSSRIWGTRTSSRLAASRTGMEMQRKRGIAA